MLKKGTIIDRLLKCIVNVWPGQPALQSSSDSSWQWATPSHLCSPGIQAPSVHRYSPLIHTPGSPENRQHTYYITQTHTHIFSFWEIVYNGINRRGNITIFYIQNGLLYLCVDKVHLPCKCCPMQFLPFWRCQAFPQVPPIEQNMMIYNNTTPVCCI